MRRLEGKVGLITGAARGLGAATAARFAEEGAALVLTDRIGETLAATADSLAETGAEVMFREHDVTDEPEWERLMSDVTKRFGGLDVLVNNAGTNRRGYIEDFTLKDWRLVMGVNLEGVFLGIKHAIPAMRPRAERWRGGGSIVNISSIAGYVGLMGSTAYCASKGGVRLLTKSAATECARRGHRIRVNSVHPGYIETDGLQMSLENMTRLGAIDDPETGRDAYRDKHPVGRLGEPRDIADAVAYLASDDAAFVTGTELVVDGGYTAE